MTVEELLPKHRPQLKSELLHLGGGILKAAIVSLMVLSITAPLSHAHQHGFRIYTVPPKRTKAKPSKPPAVPKRQATEVRGARQQRGKPPAVKQQAGQEQGLREQTSKEQALDKKGKRPIKTIEK
jgi:hypothetical protein